MPSSIKARENRIRRMAERQGFRLRKSRRRDPLAANYGTFWLEDGEGLIRHGLPIGSLETVEEFLQRDRTQR